MIDLLLFWLLNSVLFHLFYNSFRYFFMLIILFLFLLQFLYSLLKSFNLIVELDYLFDELVLFHFELMTHL